MAIISFTLLVQASMLWFVRLYFKVGSWLRCVHFQDAKPFASDCLALMRAEFHSQDRFLTASAHFFKLGSALIVLIEFSHELIQVHHQWTAYFSTQYLPTQICNKADHMPFVMQGSKSQILATASHYDFDFLIAF